MRYCNHCGNELLDEAIVCPNCGCDVKQSKKSNNCQRSKLGTAALVFMIIMCVIKGLWIFPLAWMLPMTIVLSSKQKNGEPIDVGFKICALIFCSVIGGILLLCDNDNN